MSLAYYQKLADEWDAGGRTELVTHDYQLTGMFCWMQGAMKKKIPVPANVRAWVAHSWAAQKRLYPNWYWNFLGQRENCDMCGARYLLENLSFCTRLNSTYCWDCRGRFEISPITGNPMCSCGGEIVG